MELRSVNGRFLDLALRLPDEHRALEPALRELLTARFKRGKVELRVTGTADSEGGDSEPTPEQLAHLGLLESRVRELLPNARPLSVHEAMQWCPGAARNEGAAESVLDAYSPTEPMFVAPAPSAASMTLPMFSTLRTST